MPLTNRQLKALRESRVPSSRNRIATACDIAEIPRMDIARATGLSPQYISDVVNGRFSGITVENARKFSEFFGCAIEDLFPSREAMSA
jgi:transcriptional regulator with XRE-family HTH domain